MINIEISEWIQPHDIKTQQIIDKTVQAFRFKLINSSFRWRLPYSLISIHVPLTGRAWLASGRFEWDEFSPRLCQSELDIRCSFHRRGKTRKWLRTRDTYWRSSRGRRWTNGQRRGQRIPRICRLHLRREDAFKAKAAVGEGKQNCWGGDLEGCY